MANTHMAGTQQTAAVSRLVASGVRTGRALRHPLGRLGLGRRVGGRTGEGRLVPGDTAREGQSTAPVPPGGGEWDVLAAALGTYWSRESTQDDRDVRRAEAATIGFRLAQAIARRWYRDWLEREEAPGRAVLDLLWWADRVAAGHQEPPRNPAGYARTLITHAVRRPGLEKRPSWQAIEDEVRDLANGSAPEVRFREWDDPAWQCTFIWLDDPSPWDWHDRARRRRLTEVLGQPEVLLQRARRALRLHRRRFRSKTACAMAAVLAEAGCPLPRALLVELVGALLGAWRPTVALPEEGAARGISSTGPAPEDGSDHVSSHAPSSVRADSAAADYLHTVAQALRGNPVEWEIVSRKPPARAEWLAFVLGLERWVRQELFAAMGGLVPAVAVSGSSASVLVGPAQPEQQTYSDLEVFGLAAALPPFSVATQRADRQRCLLVADTRRNLRDRLRAYARAYHPASPTLWEIGHNLNPEGRSGAAAGREAPRRVALVCLLLALGKWLRWQLLVHMGGQQSVCAATRLPSAVLDGPAEPSADIYQDDLISQVVREELSPTRHTDDPSRRVVRERSPLVARLRRLVRTQHQNPG